MASLAVNHPLLTKRDLLHALTADLNPSRSSLSIFPVAPPLVVDFSVAALWTDAEGRCRTLGWDACAWASRDVFGDSEADFGVVPGGAGRVGYGS